MSIYDQRPWLKFYSKNVPGDYELPTMTAIDVFENTALEKPNVAAVHYFDGTISYSELNTLSDSFAVALAELGVVKEDRVCLYLQNVPQFLIAQYAAWKLGATVVPINPMYRERELAYYLTDSRPKVMVSLESIYESTARKVVRETSIQKVITTSGLDYLPQGYPVPKALAGTKKVSFDETLDMVGLVERNKGRKPRREHVLPGDVAHFIYTSGTTGPSKGAMNTHLGIVFNSRVYAEWNQLTNEDVILGVGPLFHVTGTVAHIGAAAYAGIPVVLFFRFDAGEALKMIEKWKTTWTIAPTTVYTALLSHPDFRSRNISSLRKPFTGGSPTFGTVIDGFEQVSGLYLQNMYGLTESTSPSHMPPLGVRAPVDAETGALSIGLPVPNTYVKVVDVETGKTEMPVGDTGEIIIKGPAVIPGYWGRPEETSNAIRDGWLFTGDIGKMDENGWFYVLDRKKDLINASGYKIWPRDIEDVIYQHPAIREAAVIGVPDEYRGETVKAFVSLKEGYKGRVTPEMIIDFCRQRMAAYKYPRIVEIMPDLPKTPFGKILKRVLKEHGT